jgi:hypothetical protein
MNDLVRELLASLGMVALMVVVHMLGLTGLIRLTDLHLKHLRTPWLSLDRLVVPLGIVTGLFILHGIEVVTYAVAYIVLGVVRDLETALYVSAGSYSTAGWAGVHIEDSWRVMVALEGLNGLILIGWSTAFLFQTLQRLLAGEHGHPLPEGAIAKVSPRDSRSGSGAPVGTNSSDTELMQ